MGPLAHGLTTHDEDVIGRRPVVFTGLVGIAATTMMFGLSTSFAGIVASRFLGQFQSPPSFFTTYDYVHVSTSGGLVAGNVAVIHSILAEITDDTNQDLAVPIYSLAWPVGTVIGLACLFWPLNMMCDTRMV